MRVFVLWSGDDDFGAQSNLAWLIVLMSVGRNRLMPRSVGGDHNGSSDVGLYAASKSFVRDRIVEKRRTDKTQLRQCRGAVYSGLGRRRNHDADRHCVLWA